MRKLRKNLSLDPEAVARGERYIKLHGTTLSQLVNRFLWSLPLNDNPATRLTPSVSRLIGLVSDQNALEHYRQHLVEKYGR
jgi:hypothetical protein